MVESHSFKQNKSYHLFKKKHRTWDDYVKGKRLDSKTTVMCFLSYVEDREGREELTLK